MKPFKIFINETFLNETFLNEADYRRFLKKNKNLDKSQIDQINNYFSRINQKAGSEIDWQSKEIQNLSYEDFQEIMDKYSSGFKPSRIKVKGQEGEDYINVKIKNKKYRADIPLNYETAQFMNSCEYGFINVNYCIGDSQYKETYWKKYVLVNKKVPVYIVNGTHKWVVMVHEDNKTYEVWDKLNNRDLAKDDKEPIPNFSIQKELIQGKAKFYDDIREEYYKVPFPQWFQDAIISEDAEYEFNNHGEIIWYRGTFTGEWKGGSFHKGGTLIGDFNPPRILDVFSGTFKGGVFKSGIFYEGTWLSGTFNDKYTRWDKGYDENGYIHEYPPELWGYENIIKDLNYYDIIIDDYSHKVKGIIDKYGDILENIVELAENDQITSYIGSEEIRLVEMSKTKSLMIINAELTEQIDYPIVYTECKLKDIDLDMEKVNGINECNVYNCNFDLLDIDNIIYSSNINSCNINLRENIAVSFSLRRSDITNCIINGNGYIFRDYQRSGNVYKNIISKASYIRDSQIFNSKLELIGDSSLYEECVFDDKTWIDEKDKDDIYLEDCNKTVDELIQQGKL